MSSVVDHRRANFRRLVEQAGGPREAAIKWDMNESQVSQLISANIKKPMGHKLARKIEAAAGLPAGVLDQTTSIDGRNLLPVPVITNRDIGAFDHISSGDWLDDPQQRQQVIWDNSNPYRPIGPLVAMYLQDGALDGIANEGDLAIFDCWPCAKGSPERVKIGSIVALIDHDTLIARVIKQVPKGYEFMATSPLYAPVTRKDARDILGVLVEVRWMKPRLRS